MSLSINSLISIEDFNNLKNRVLLETKRRTLPEIDALGNKYNNNPFTTIPIISDAQTNYPIDDEQFDKILNFFNNFNSYPGKLNVTYHDGKIIVGDIVYALDELLNIMSELENEARQNNNDCKSGCMGLCTNNCSNQCTSCTGCTSCSGCDGSCQGCSGYCGGCGGCGGCSGGCSGGCEGTGRSNACGFMG